MIFSILLMVLSAAGGLACAGIGWCWVVGGLKCGGWSDWLFAGGVMVEAILESKANGRLDPGAAAHTRLGGGTGFRGVEEVFPSRCAAPLNVNGANTYQFVVGDPVGRVDPTGTSIGGAIGGFVGGWVGGIIGGVLGGAGGAVAGGGA